MSRYRWYLSAAAVREYLDIAGLDDDDGGPNWARAERELGAHCAEAHEAGHNDTSIRYRTGRVKVGDRERATRLELFVRHNPREEGEKPQLVSVQDKDGGRIRRSDASIARQRERLREKIRRGLI